MSGLDCQDSVDPVNPLDEVAMQLIGDRLVQAPSEGRYVFISHGGSVDRGSDRRPMFNATLARRILQKAGIPFEEESTNSERYVWFARLIVPQSDLQAYMDRARELLMDVSDPDLGNS